MEKQIIFTEDELDKIDYLLYDLQKDIDSLGGCYYFITQHHINIVKDFFINLKEKWGSIGSIKNIPSHYDEINIIINITNALNMIENIEINRRTTHIELNLIHTSFVICKNIINKYRRDK